MTPHRRWDELTTAEFATLDRERAVAVLPVAAIEQHGPHLPLGVDALLAEGILARALALVPEAPPILALPSCPIGHSPEHLGFPGTLSLSAETLIRLWTELGDGVARAGVRRLVIFNGHGGNPPAMDIVARELRLRHEMLVVPVSWFDLVDRDGLFPAAERRYGIHGGAIETSMMLALRPDLVRRDRLADFPSAAPGFGALDPSGQTGFAWATQDLNPAGAVGDARLADAEKGRRLIDACAEALVKLLAAVAQFPLDRLRAGPLV